MLLTQSTSWDPVCHTFDLKPLIKDAIKSLMSPQNTHFRARKISEFLWERALIHPSHNLFNGSHFLYLPWVPPNPNPLGGPAYQSAVKTDQVCWVWWRWKVSFVYIPNVCPCSTHTHTHTHTHRTAKLSDQPYKHWIRPYYLRKPRRFSFFKPWHRTTTFTVYLTPHTLDGTTVRSYTALIANNFHHALTSNRFWVGPQAPQPFIYPFVYQPTCTTL